MWQWNPAKCIASDLTTRSAASRALPFDTVKPNFESSAPVAMYSCVCASTPGVTRTSTRARRRGRAATSASMRSSSSNESATMRPTPRVEREPQLGVGLVVAVEHDARRREAGVERELRARRRSRRRGAAPRRPPGGPWRRRGTPCPRTTPRRHRTPSRYSAAACPQLGLGVHVERRAVLARERVEVDPSIASRPAASTVAVRGSSPSVERCVDGVRHAHDSGSSSRRRAATSRRARARRAPPARWRDRAGTPPPARAAPA